MPKLATASGISSDDEFDDAVPIVADADADADAEEQVNGELHHEEEKVTVVRGRGETQESDTNEDTDGDEDEAEGEYNVEAIRSHRVVKGKVSYTIKWQGYPEDENTQEPESNLLPHARKILAEYHKKIGGRPEPKLKKSKSKQSLRRQASEEDSPAPAAKRQKRNGADAGAHADADADAEGSEPDSSWVPPREDWEPLVVKVDTVERDENDQLLAYILFANGKKTKVSMDKVYRHCPRPMLRFYESHLKFK